MYSYVHDLRAYTECTCTCTCTSLAYASTITSKYNVHLHHTKVHKARKVYSKCCFVTCREEMLWEELR